MFKEYLLQSSRKKGATLLEMLIAITIFSIIIVAALGIFNTTLRNGSTEKGRQQGLEDMSLAMDYIVKTVRFTSYVSGSTGILLDSFTVNQNETNVTLTYCFNTSAHELRENGGAGCSGGNLIASDVTGHFIINQLRDDSYSDPTTTVTIFMQKAGVPETKVQSTVTLHDYNK